ncbi:unnamed protein product [Ixodes persulcatus]
MIQHLKDITNFQSFEPGMLQRQRAGLTILPKILTMLQYKNLTKSFDTAPPNVCCFLMQTDKTFNLCLGSNVPH